MTSNPAGAKVTIDGSSVQFTTPAKVNLKRNSDYALTFTMDGQKSQTMTLEKGLNGWVFGNILFGGIVGVAIDFISGASNELKPGKVHVDFSPPVAASPPTALATPAKRSTRNLSSAKSPPN